MIASKKMQLILRKNTILHLAVKYNKLQLVKFLINEMNYSIEDCNNEGQTPLSIAQSNNLTEIFNFLKPFDKKALNKIDQELLDLIDESKEKKTKKNKKKKNKTFGLGTSEYESNLKENENVEKKKQEVEENKTIEKEKK